MKNLLKPYIQTFVLNTLNSTTIKNYNDLIPNIIYIKYSFKYILIFKFSFFKNFILTFSNNQLLKSYYFKCNIIGYNLIKPIIVFKYKIMIEYCTILQTVVKRDSRHISTTCIQIYFYRYYAITRFRFISSA